ncbi:MAG: DUF4097 family beta strand repeat protein [Parasporobacterium sp.]|nr:DUF4097 family beta strand repeat protein [Parasporobacterium sp.]
MRKHRKLLITAIVLLIAGAVICGASFAGLGFSVKALASGNYVTNSYEITEEFRSISVQGDTEEIVFAPSEDGTCKVVCFEDEQEPHQVRVEKETLLIDRQNSRKWKINFFSEPETITVYLPETVYGDLVVDADTGNVTVPDDFTFDSIQVKLDTGNIDLSASAKGAAVLDNDTGRIEIHEMSAGSITLSNDTGYIGAKQVTCAETFETSSTTGKTELSDVTAADLYSDGDTGSLVLSNVIATGEFHIERETGSVRFEGCDAEAIYVETDTGSVTGTLLSDKVFFAESDTGSVNVPKTITGGRCEITTDTGSINISIE